MANQVNGQALIEENRRAGFSEQGRRRVNVFGREYEQVTFQDQTNPRSMKERVARGALGILAGPFNGFQAVREATIQPAFNEEGIVTRQTLVPIEREEGAETGKEINVGEDRFTTTDRESVTEFWENNRHLICAKNGHAFIKLKQHGRVLFLPNGDSPTPDLNKLQCLVIYNAKNGQEIKDVNFDKHVEVYCLTYDEMESGKSEYIEILALKFAKMNDRDEPNENDKIQAKAMVKRCVLSGGGTHGRWYVGDIDPNNTGKLSSGRYGFRVKFDKETGKAVQELLGQTPSDKFKEADKMYKDAQQSEPGDDVSEDGDEVPGGGVGEP